MVVDALRAENVLKYAVLRLEDVPPRGLIAVIGDNESGKSSIGESICFALFGRTFSLGPGDLDKVIRWGESRCSIRLDFTTPDGQGYQVARFLDELGNHGASVSRRGEQPMVRGVDEVEAALRDIIGFGYTEFIESFYLAQREITTPHPHSFAVKAMAGVDVLEKVRSGCREEIERAERQGQETGAQKADIEAQIASIGLEPRHLASLEDERRTLAGTVEADRSRITALKAVVEHNDSALSSLRGAAQEWLAVPLQASSTERRRQWERHEALLTGLRPRYGADELTSESFAAFEALAQDSRERIDAWDRLLTEADTYRLGLARALGEAPDDQENSATGVAVPKIPQRRAELEAREAGTRASRGTAVGFALASLIFALGAWGLWILLSEAPDISLARDLAARLSALVPDWDSRLLPWIPWAAGVLTFLSAALLARGAQLGRRLSALQAERAAVAAKEAAARDDLARLADLHARPLPEIPPRLAGLGDPDLAARAAELARGRGALLIDVEAHVAYQADFKQRLKALEDGIAAIRTAALRETERLHEAIAEGTSSVARLDSAIERERERVKRHLELTEIATLLRTRIQELAHRVRARELSIDLLAGAIHYISQRFNTEIRNLAADSLPKFTNGRYEHLQIDENLRVKAFSGEKRNFMELDEISSGTQRQIMLAVRLALSQKLVNSVIQGPQMVFLDEPFAFFDEGRTASALAVLPQVSPDFTQIWVTSQTFPADSHFDLCIECTTAESHSPRVSRPAATASAEVPT